MLAIGNGELTKPLGKTVKCWKCGKSHRVKGTVYGPLAWFNCKGKAYLCGVDGMAWRPKNAR